VSSDERIIDLERVRSDGWYEQLVDAVPALDRLCVALGDVVVALAIAAGFRVQTLNTDRMSATVTELQWTHQTPHTVPSAEDSHADLPPQKGSLAALKTAVLAVLVGEAEPVVAVQALDLDDPTQVRSLIGLRSVLLAPLFGLSLRELRVSSDASEEPRVVIAHDDVEEVVPLRQFRRFLRQRVVELLQGDSGRGQVSIDLTQAELARVALEQGRPAEAVARLMSWLGPLSMFHRTAEGQALDRGTRAKLARALGVLASAFGQLDRRDEEQETMRLALQYAHDNDAAAELYFALGRTLLAETRYSEAIAPLRRALSLGALAAQVLPKLSIAMTRSGRAVAGVGCLLRARQMAADSAAIDEAERVLALALGPAYSTLTDWLEQNPSLEAETTEIPKLPS
jgi:tetratricopeptide (TPR) repeat protein